MRLRWVPMAGLVILATSCAGGGSSVWDELAPSDARDGFGNGELIYSSLSEIVPGGIGTPGLRPADAIVRGHVVDTEKGIGFGGPDAPSASVVDFDDPRAVAKSIALVVRVEEVVSGHLRSGDAKEVRIQWALPTGKDLEAIDKLIDSTDEIVAFVSPADERMKADGKRIPEAAFYSRTYLAIGGAVVGADGDDVVTPLWTDDMQRALMPDMPKDVASFAKTVGDLSRQSGS
ncbi:exported hypothetical protein [Nostocoides australiense Ben110]|uniref:Lipoprotein n=2 Tax=Nostocoides australiense TaxID=99480 RepID=W6JVS3_9MICO|nr:hypothetical protein [Actinomycetota bacterium]CCH72675.1 exported hypothetical protein [Tetrasphaera australiensis Ben110]